MTRLVVFDVDSTLLEVETLDYALARAAGAPATGGGPGHEPDFGAAGRSDLPARLEGITAAGMEGRLELSESLTRRLALVSLSRADVRAAAREIAGHATPDIAALLSDLRARGDRVRAVSGGFRELVLPALARLGFDDTDVRANTFLWEDAVVAGFDRACPLSRSGGKAKVVASLCEELGPDTTVMVGDGMTDLEVWEAGAAERFIGFGAVACRDAVRRRAPEWAATVRELGRLLL